MNSSEHAIGLAQCAEEPTTRDDAEEACLVVDTVGAIVWVNQAAEILLDLPAGKLIGRPLDAVLPGPRASPDRVRHSHGRRGQWVAAQRGDGTTIDVSIERVVPEDSAAELVAIRLRNHTSRARVEQALWASRQHLRGLINNAADAIVSVGADGLITLFNSSAAAIFGYAPEEVLGRPLTVLMPERFRAAHGEHMARFARSGETARPMGGRATISGLRKDGTEFPAEATISISEVDGEIFHNVILRDVTERRRIEAALAAAQARSEEASRAKSEFLAQMSHELRTPLNAVIGFSEMIREDVLGGLGNPAYGDYAAHIHRSGHHLLALINDILDLSKIEAGKVEIEEQPFDPLEAAEMCLDLINERAARQNICIVTRFAGDACKLCGDERRFKQIVLNLLTNAVKFTMTGGTVTVATDHQAGSAWRIAVCDTGIGMTESEIAKAMEPFGRVETMTTRNIEGTGLGLPLVKSLCDLHEARLDIVSAPGDGTTVTVEFPTHRVIEASPS